MSQELLPIIKNNIQKHIPLNNQKLIVGVSGGPDSMALLDCLRKLQLEYSLIIIVAHIEHGFRGQTSIDDAAYVEAYCQQHQLIFELRAVNMPEIIKQTKGSSQELSRKQRYSWYRELSTKYQTPYIILGHHQDDQVETVLMRIIQGTSTDGLAGMRMCQERDGMLIIRPLLTVSKRDLELYCQENQLKPRIDASNASNKYLRNKARNQLIPYLEEYNPNVKGAILNLAELAGEAEHYIYQHTKEAYDSIVTALIDAKEYRIDRKKMVNLHCALQRRLILLILYYLKTGERIEKKHIDMIIDWIKGTESGGYLQLPANLIVIRESEQLIIRIQPQDIKLPAESLQAVRSNWLNEGVLLQQEPKPLMLGQKLKLLTGQFLYADIINRADAKLLRPNQSLVIYDAEFLQGKSLYYRSRKDGDRMTIVGMKGTKKVKDILIDGKMPSRIRDNVPVIIVDDQIIWLAGVRRSNIAPVTDNTTEVLFMQITND
jgi:tRNA(Ile)-lysidine synthase